MYACVCFVHAGEPALTDEDKADMRDIVEASVERNCTRVGVAVGKAAVRACMHSSAFMHAMLQACIRSEHMYMHVCIPMCR
jgi:hypothetical protein